MQKPLKPTYFMNEMHDYEFKSFYKKKKSLKVFQKHLNSTQIFQ